MAYVTMNGCNMGKKIEGNRRSYSVGDVVFYGENREKAFIISLEIEDDKPVIGIVKCNTNERLFRLDEDSIITEYDYQFL